MVTWYRCVRGSSWTSATWQVSVLDRGVDEPGEKDPSWQLTVSERWLYVRCYATCLSGIISLDLNINLARSILLISSGMVSDGWSNNSLQITAAAAAKSLQSCPTLCDPRDGSPPGSPVPGILQARTLEWVDISFSSAWKWKVKVKSLIRVRLLATSWTAAHQAPLSMGFARQECWSGVPSPSPPNNSNYKVKHLSHSHFVRARSWQQLCAQLKVNCGSVHIIWDPG